MPDPFDSPTLLGDEPARDPLIGRQVRDLRILELIGQGGMGAVYKAEHLLLREPRALKVMRAELFRSVPNAVERFEREARIAVKLRHPNLVLLYDFFVEDGHHFLVMEYVVGTSLAALLRERGALSVEETCRIGIQCCAGLAHAHEMGIVHRDLSPENVMLAPTAAGPSVKIIDFGVARAAFASREQSSAEADTTLTRAGMFLGKPRYASPEQAGVLRRGETLDHRSDLYTLGLILYEMATGDLPFHSETAVGYLSQHAFQEPARPTEVAPDRAIPAGLERVILRCLEKERGRRFASAGELGAALEWAWRSGDPRDAPFEWELDARRASRRSPLLPIAAGATLAVLAVGGAAFWWSGRREVILPPVSSGLPQPTSPVAPREALARSAPPLLEKPDPAPAPEVDDPPPAPPAPPTEERLTPPTTKPPEQGVDRKPPRVEPQAMAFVDTAEMQRAFDAALAFERSHEPAAAIASWKRFRGRSPSRELDEQAKRHITDLTLRSLPGFR